MFCIRAKRKGPFTGGFFPISVILSQKGVKTIFYIYGLSQRCVFLRGKGSENVNKFIVSMNKKRRIIVTAPKIYNKKLKTVLTGNNFEVLQSPVIETILFDNPVFKVFFEEIHTFDYIILPSRNAIRSFVQQAKKYKLSKNVLQTLNFAVIGKDAEFLSRFELTSKLKTEETSTVGIFRALKKIKSMNKLAVLTPRVEIINEPDIIPDFIKRLNSIAEVTQIDAYITRPNKNPKLKILQKIKKSDYDLIAFTSGGEIEALKYLLNNETLFSQLKVACFGPYTASSALQSGLKPKITGTDFSSFEGFADALKSYFRKQETDPNF